MFEAIKAEANKRQERNKNIVSDYKNGLDAEYLSFKYRVTRKTIIGIVSLSLSKGGSSDA